MLHGYNMDVTFEVGNGEMKQGKCYIREREGYLDADDRWDCGRKEDG